MANKIPSRAERFRDAVDLYRREKANAEPFGNTVAFTQAMEALAGMAWNLAPQIEEGLVLQERREKIAEQGQFHDYPKR